MRLSRLALLLVSFAFLLSSARAADWTHWRGPMENGHSLDKGLPAEFDPAMKAKGNVAWTAPYGGRSAPLVVGGRIYVFQGFGEGPAESERVVCLDEKTGKMLWEHVERVYHTDVVSSRLAWTPMTADPATGYVYANTTAGNLVCLDKDGKMMWERNVTEEFGRFTGYGGRVSAPLFDSGLVIIGFVNSSWGDQARGGNRYFAFDAKTGQVVWIGQTGLTIKSTYQSNPVVAVIGGQRLLITGGGDGALHAFKVRTGELVWSYLISNGAVNPSPVVSGNLVYCGHGEENPGGGIIGRVVCLDAGQLDPATKQPKLVWEYRRGQRFGLSSPALADGILYFPEDSGELVAFDAKTGKVLWRYRYGTEVRGAPLVADGKVYIFDVKGKMLIIPLDGRKKPDSIDVFDYTFREKGKQTETNGTPIAVNGRVYFTTRTDLICLAEAGAKPAEAKYPSLPAETPFQEGAVAGARLFPAEATAHAGEAVKFTVVFFDANGREVKHASKEKADWSLPLPPKTPAGAQPPALAGKAEGDAAAGTLTLAPMPTQQGYIEFKAGGVTARARVRVAANLPFKADFEKAPAGSSPGGWVNTNGKFVVKKLPDGNTVLAKTNTDARPPLAKANGYMTVPGVSDYTITADVMGGDVRGKLPDAGLINSRYVLVLDGKRDPDFNKRTLRINSWEARPRISAVVAFDWQPDTWYTMKLTIDYSDKVAVVRGKVWKKGEAEPAAWTIEAEDAFPNRGGAAGLYGYISNVQENDDGSVAPGSDLYFDNLSITPDAKK